MKKKYPLISIIVPVYNVECYLPRCIDSILNQTYHNLEVILIDDGSTDRSGDICNEYATADSRVKVFHQENQGVSAARNIGLDYSTGDYIGFVDSDDWIEEYMYDTLLESMRGTAQISSIRSFDYGKGHQKTLSLTSREAILDLCLPTVGMEVNVWSKLVERRLFDEIRFDKDIFVGEDMLVSSLLYEKADLIVFCDRPCYHYSRRLGSAMNSYSLKDWTVQIASERIFQRVVQLFPDERETAVGMIVNQDVLLAKKMALSKSLTIDRYNRIKNHAVYYGAINYKKINSNHICVMIRMFFISRRWFIATVYLEALLLFIRRCYFTRKHDKENAR